MLALVVVLSFAWNTNTSYQASPNSRTLDHNKAQYQGQKLQSAIGVPAITPSQPGIPAFTIDDVKHYLASHSFEGGPTVDRSSYSIDTIQFLKAKQASVLMQGEVVGLPDDALVCYTVLRGPFILQNVRMPPGEPIPATPIASRGVEVFDARTGNLLVWGT